MDCIYAYIHRTRKEALGVCVCACQRLVVVRCICVCACATNHIVTHLVQWDMFLPVTECSWSVNIDKCALQGHTPPCSSHMPQPNEFLKTASIKPQARSIDHRVDFISVAEHG